MLIVLQVNIGQNRLLFGPFNVSVFSIQTGKVSNFASGNLDVVCAVNAVCTNTPGSYTCACDVGYEGFDPRKLCIDSMCPWNQWGKGTRVERVLTYFVHETLNLERNRL